MKFGATIETPLNTVEPGLPPLRAVIIILLFLSVSGYSRAGADDSYSINADQVQVDDKNSTITYQGNAKAVVSNLIIEADTISIVSRNGLPSKITASGDPIRFQEKVSKHNINGTAQEVTFVLAEFKLTLINYSITDPSGNNMKGKKASFILSP